MSSGHSLPSLCHDVRVKNVPVLALIGVCHVTAGARYRPVHHARATYYGHIVRHNFTEWTGSGINARGWKSSGEWQMKLFVF